MFDIVQVAMPTGIKSNRKGSDKVSVLLETLSTMPTGNAFYVNTITDEEMEKTQRRIYNAQRKIRIDSEGAKDFQVILFQGDDVEKAKALFKKTVVGPGWGIWRVK